MTAALFERHELPRPLTRMNLAVTLLSQLDWPQQNSNALSKPHPRAQWLAKKQEYHNDGSLPVLAVKLLAKKSRATIG